MSRLVFGVETPSDPQDVVYMNKTKKRLESPDLAKNPYSEVSYACRQSKKTGNNIFLFVLTPSYPEIYIYSWLPAIILFLPVWTWVKIIVVIIAFLMLTTALFTNKTFTYFFMKIGAKKAGCKVDKWRVLSPSECVERLI